ncbi:MAG: CBS domain-containing protein [Desulfurococcaceae archaeon]|jgi:CBS domain-containing protein|nr:CBS domain-containing protein [Desulfurococcaceae archaeon]
MPVIRRSRKFPIRVADIMSTPPITAGENAPVEEIAKIMNENNIGSVMIVDSRGVLTGIITERDLIYAIANGKIGKGLPAYMIMTENPVTIEPGSPIDEALQKMRENNIRHLPVVNSEKKPVGMVSLRDVIDAVLAFIKVFT